MNTFMHDICFPVFSTQIPKNFQHSSTASAICVSYTLTAILWLLVAIIPALWFVCTPKYLCSESQRGSKTSLCGVLRVTCQSTAMFSYAPKCEGRKILLIWFFGECLCAEEGRNYQLRNMGIHSLLFLFLVKKVQLFNKAFFIRKETPL